MPRVEGDDIRELWVVELHQAGLVEPVDAAASERLDLRGAAGLYLCGHGCEAAAGAAIASSVAFAAAELVDA
ncbi:hypothetical protein Xvtw_18405 [Xanthomonas campestris pv. vitiswoodrowii]|nr:hypothetical protein Xvtw_18405 [Xanthomonas campestris pv. vitiswoodrowii]